MIDPATVQKIKDTADIVDVVSDYVHLVRRGANYMGLCPFHNERTPSFSVNKSRNFCYCFSCHKGGSPINFIMEKEGVSYHEALLHLAKKYGIEVKERELTNEEIEQQTRREGMLVANEWAKNYFTSNLLQKEEGQNVGLSYLYGRHVTQEAIKAFALGYAIDRFSDYTDEAIKKGFSLDILKATGLTGTSQNGRNYDRFRGRIIFPVINTAGKVVAFGGRDLKGDSAKYINSPESEVYSKSRELYGIFQAKGDIVKENKVYLVEGYLDVIGMWQSGIRNVVASSGTALTDGQISLIHRFTDNVTLIYDGDSAGIKASLRGIDMLLAHNLNVKAVPLPEGDDPDSLAAKLTPQQLKDYLKENEVDIIRFKINVLLDDARNDPQKRWLVVRSIVESIANISDKIKRDIYIQECSALLDVKESSLSSEVAKARWKIVEQEKTKRRSEELQKDFSKENVNPGETISSQLRQIDEKTLSSPLYPLERELIDNCLKYGFVDIFESEGSESETVQVSVIEYIAEELEIDNISFTVPDHIKIFNELLQLLPQFRRDLKENDNVIAGLIEQKRKEGYETIGALNLSVNEIKREENSLEDRLSSFAENERERFAKNYILDKFGSHEDDVIRNNTNRALVEKHQLSSLFKKNKSQENSKEKIVSLVISSLNILKNGIIDIQLKMLMEELKNLDHSNEDKERELHSRISEIISMRSRMAKDIGDRILCPTNLKTNNRNAANK
ncbi:MAG: DNA primase [Muribaculaceae bacterium]|nr:DNA primase [Muribaculaceae bacterium]